MTPQIHPRSKVSSSSVNSNSNPFLGAGRDTISETAPTGPGRYSLGGEARRVVVKSEPLWKVKDIVVPQAEANSGNTPQRAGPFVGPGTPGMGAGAGMGMPSPSRATRTVVDEEERKVFFVFYSSIRNSNLIFMYYFCRRYGSEDGVRFERSILFSLVVYRGWAHRQRALLFPLLRLHLLHPRARFQPPHPNCYLL